MLCCAMVSYAIRHDTILNCVMQHDMCLCYPVAHHNMPSCLMCCTYIALWRHITSGIMFHYVTLYHSMMDVMYRTVCISYDMLYVLPHHKAHATCSMCPHVSYYTCISMYKTYTNINDCVYIDYDNMLFI